MSLSMISGVVSAFRIVHGPSTGTVHNDQVTVNTTRTASFRIGNRQVAMSVVPELVDGDLVVAAGKETSGHFRVIAVRNETTKMIYSEPYFGTWGLGVMLVSPILVLPTFKFDPLVGLIFLTGGVLLSLGAVWNWFKRIPVLAAWEMVKHAPPVPPVTT